MDIILPGGTTSEQIKSSVQNGGKWVHIKYEYPQVYITPARLTKVSTGDIISGHSKWVSLVDVVRGMQDENGQVVGLMKVDLPFPCDQNFVTEGLVGGEGINMYEHEREDYRDAGQFHYILHLELTSVEKVRKMKGKYVPTKVIGGQLSRMRSPSNPFATT